jgi:thiosulfate dehydrogenase [quinone] large subunit
MFVTFLKENKYVSIFLVIVRLYLGYEWIHAGYTKLTEGFDATGFLEGAIANSTGPHPAVQTWWASFLDGFAIPNVGLFNFLVPWGELLVGIALIIGCFTTFAALMAIIMNFAFMFSGSTSTNVQMALLTFFILVAGYNAGKIGADHWVVPIIREQFNMNKQKKN